MKSFFGAYYYFFYFYFSNEVKREGIAPVL